MDEKSIEKLLNMFERDRFVKAVGIQIISVTESGAVCTLATDDSHLNANDTVQGGAVYTLADFAFAVAANAGGINTVTLNGSISYVRGARGGVLTATAIPVHQGRTTCVFTVNVTDEAGKLIATANFTGARLG